MTLTQRRLTPICVNFLTNTLGRRMQKHSFHHRQISHFLIFINDNTDVEEATEKAIHEAGGNANGAAEAIEGKARRVNTDWNSGDAEEYRLFQ